MKYYFTVDGYVEYLRERKVSVNAQSLEEAVEKAEEKFRNYFYARGATQVAESLRVYPCNQYDNVNVKRNKITKDQVKPIIQKICPDWEFIR